MKFPARIRRIWQVRQSAAAFLALAFTVFAVLVPALHEHGSWGKPGSRSLAQRGLTASAGHASTGIRAAARAPGTNSDCPACDWLVAAVYAATPVTALLLFLLTAFLLPALALCVPSLCARPSPRRATRAPPISLAA